MRYGTDYKFDWVKSFERFDQITGLKVEEEWTLVEVFQDSVKAVLPIHSLAIVGVRGDWVVVENKNIARGRFHSKEAAERYLVRKKTEYLNLWIEEAKRGSFD